METPYSKKYYKGFLCLLHFSVKLMIDKSIIGAKRYEYAFCRYRLLYNAGDYVCVLTKDYPRMISQSNCTLQIQRYPDGSQAADCRTPR